VAVAAFAVAATAVPSARADLGTGWGGGAPTIASIESHVEIRVSESGKDGKHLTSVGGSWDPPACWYEPQYTPEEFDTVFQQILASLSGAMGATAKAQYDALKADQDFHRGQDGRWWGMVKTKKAWDLPESAPCTQKAGIVWVPTGNPPAGMLAVTPLMLSRLAYGATKLPPPSVKLSPAPDRQTVNLPTYVSFEQPIQPVSVTASLNYQGVNIAASTLAVPVSLRIDAGTSDASPAMCTYPFTKSGGGYQVDSSGAACNITYQRSSRGGSYPLTAQVTWKVTWTPSKNPNASPANPLPDGVTGGAPQDVVVREIQTVVTG
jgi:enoyl reductase